MIYIIIGTNTSTGNEWVESDTFDNAADAAERCTVLRTFFDAKDSTYRVETVEPSESKSTARLYADKTVALMLQAAGYKALAEHKAALNAEFGKHKMDHEEGYTDTPHVRTDDFTVKELFGDIPLDVPGNCGECGSIVWADFMSVHTAWHNKLLP